MDISFAAAINDRSILRKNLESSCVFDNDRRILNLYENRNSASTAYIEGINDSASDYMIFAHQDVYLPAPWIDRLKIAIAHLNRTDQRWAVLGVVGVTADNEHVGRAWSSGIGRVIGRPLDRPVEVVSVDEMVIVLRRQSGCMFDPDLPGFHLYGTDIVQIARSQGGTAYVADLPVVHNSRPVVDLDRGFTSAYRYMRNKWASRLPINTLIVPVARSMIPLYRARARLIWTRKSRLQKAVDPSQDPRMIAEMVGFE